MAHLRTNEPRLARVDFAALLAHPGEAPVSPLLPRAHVWSARAASRVGDVASATRGHEEFFRLWRDTDRDLAVVREARQELAALRNGPACVRTVAWPSRIDATAR